MIYIFDKTNLKLKNMVSHELHIGPSGAPDFYNTIGFVFNDRIYINAFKNKKPFCLKSVRSFRLVKRRTFSYNLRFAAASFFFFFLASFLYFKNQNIMVLTTPLLAGIVLFLFAILYRKYYYSFCFNYNDINIHIPVREYDKEDAKQFLKMVKMKFHRDQNSSRYSELLKIT
ncbi:hypothetical protein CHU92_14060 [Flavobacterium cyanobacteriorum]|uniref:Uncharacterized protein n=1 Tax=Flavobacterium cyanobacteriorum TaxID=2022802 RepID=A0A255YSL3_9FLAO|nr:hypothetical protein CHU92_14060 [Flavobacterium cyanobacteriorum]